MERVRSRFGSSILRTSYLNERVGIYAELVSILLRLGRIDEAFWVADAARGRALVEHLGAARSGNVADGDAVAAFAEGEQLLRRIDASLEMLATMRTYEVRDSSSVDSIETQLERARSRYEGLIVNAAETRGAESALLGTRQMSLTELQNVIAPDEAVVEYLVAADRVWIFVVTGDAVRAFDSRIDEEDLVSEVRVARDLLAEPGTPPTTTQPVLQDLYSLLLGPAVRAGMFSDIQRLVIIPHTVLNYLPFAALIDPVTKRYLIEDYVLQRLPTASALPVLRERERQRPAADTRALRASLFAPLASSLPFTRTETRRIKETFGGREYWNRRGTEKRIREALARGDVVHAATHGILNPRNPMFSRIELRRGSDRTSTDDGRLEVHEVLGLSIRSPLVFLSGCETGVGAAWSNQFARGEDYATLAQAFLYAGAGAVVATLWPIQDEGAAVFASYFYKAFRPGDAARALAEAQRKLIADDRFNGPFYWVGYQVAGAGK